MSFLLTLTLHSQSSFYFREPGNSLTATYQPELSMEEFTLECWLMRTGEGVSISTGRGGVEAIPIISKGFENPSHETSLNYFLGIRKEDGILVFDSESSGSAPVPFRNRPVNGFHPLETNRWYHTAVTYDKSMLRIYLNGLLETAMEISDVPSSGDESALIIGGRFTGKIDELRIWNYARTQQQITENMNREVTTGEEGLVIGSGFNEGAGTTFSSLGAIANLIGSGTNGEWAEGAPFNAPVPVSDKDPVLFTIGLIADPQYCDCDPDGIKTFRSALYKLPAAIDSMNKFKVDFVMNLGDRIDRYDASYDSVNRIYGELTMPWYNVLGNHDFSELPDSVMPLVLERNGMPDYYYGFTYKNWRFLVLDGTELASYTRSLHPDLGTEGDSVFQSVQDKVNNMPWNGGIGRTQRQWIRDQLIDAHTAEQHAIIFCHFPLYPDTVYLNLWNNEEIMDLLEEFPNVVAYLNGHYHYGNYGFRHGIHYIDQAGMLLTPDINSFSVLEVYKDKLVFRGYGLNPDRVLTWEDQFQIPSWSRRAGMPTANAPRFYPNPVTRTLFIRLDAPVAKEPVSVVLTDMNGRTLQLTESCSVDPESGLIEVSLKSGVPSGIYVASIRLLSRNVIVGKIVIKD